MSGFIELYPPLPIDGQVSISETTAIRSSQIYKIVKRGCETYLKGKKKCFTRCYIEYSFRAWGEDQCGYDFREEFSTLGERDVRYREVMLELTSDSTRCALRDKLIKEHQDETQNQAKDKIE
jgi:hypothetical protein